MSKLTNERLEEMKSNVFSLKSISEAEQIAMIDELLSLRTAAAPEMGEVEALMEKWNGPGPWEGEVVEEALQELADLARRYAAALTEERKRGDEVAGLLRWWVEFKDGFGQLEGISVGSAVNEWKENARRILAICGKEVG